MASIYDFKTLQGEVKEMKKNKVSFATVNKNANLAEGIADGEILTEILSDNFTIVRSKANDTFLSPEKDTEGNPKPEFAIYAYSEKGHRFRIDTFILDKIKPGDTITLAKGTVTVGEGATKRDIPFFTFMDVKDTDTTVKKEETKPAEKPADTVKPENG